MSKSVHLYEISDVMVEVLENGGEVSFVSAGVSMVPMLRHRMDTVVLVKPIRKLRKNDVPFYRRADGRFVLHRIIGKDDKGYILRGDNQSEKEYGVTDDMIIAVLKEFRRNGKKIGCESFKYRLYCALLPLIRFVRFRVYPIYVKAVTRFVKK